MSRDHHTIIGNFQRRSLTRSLRTQAEKGLSKLDSASGGSLKHGLPTSGFFGNYVEVSEMGDYLFIYAVNGLRPSRFKLLALSSDGEVLMPNLHERDFFKVAYDLNIHSLQEVVTFYSLTYKDYGVYEKGCPPKYIQTGLDIQQFGLDLPRQTEKSSSMEESLWWQEWGGTLFSVRYEPEKLSIKTLVIDSFVGNYQPLPLRVLR